MDIKQIVVQTINESFPYHKNPWVSNEAEDTILGKAHVRYDDAGKVMNNWVTHTSNRYDSVQKAAGILKSRGYEQQTSHEGGTYQQFNYKHPSGKSAVIHWHDGYGKMSLHIERDDKFGLPGVVTS